MRITSGKEFIVFDLENDAAPRRAAAQRERRIVEERVCRQAGTEIAVEGDADIAGCVDKRHAAVAHNGARAQKLGLHLLSARTACLVRPAGADRCPDIAAWSWTSLFVMKLSYAPNVRNTWHKGGNFVGKF